MNRYDLTPNAAENYFNSSIFGQLCTLMAEALGHRIRRDGLRRHGERATLSACTSSVLERLDRWFSRREQQARDDYLARSTDVFDLERRIEALERRSLSRYG